MRVRRRQEARCPVRKPQTITRQEALWECRGQQQLIKSRALFCVSDWDCEAGDSPFVSHTQTPLRPAPHPQADPCKQNLLGSFVLWLPVRDRRVGGDRMWNISSKMKDRWLHFVRTTTK